MNREAFKNRLESKGLGKYYNQLQPFLRNSIRLCPKVVDEDRIRIGQTKIGGRPDLPPGMDWVTETNMETVKEKSFLVFSKTRTAEVTRSQSFIAQISLAEVASFDEEQLLPKTGMLYFFYSATMEAWGNEPDDRHRFRVIYHDGDTSRLVRTPYPVDLPEEARFAATAVDVRQEVSISGEFGIHVKFTGQDEDKFIDEFYADDNFKINKLLGFADEIQGDMEWECECGANGVTGVDPTDDDPKVKAMLQNAKSWSLLLQIDSNDENNMMWYDVGRLYFWIRKDDLLQQRFDNAWLVLQCG